MTDTFTKRARVLGALETNGVLSIEVHRQSLKHKTRKVVVTHKGNYVTQYVLANLFFHDFYEVIIEAFERNNKVIVGKESFQEATSRHDFDKVIRDITDANAKELKEQYLAEMKNVQ